MIFPACSRSSIFTVQVNTVIVPESEDPVFKLILGINTLAKCGTILKFKDKKVKIDQATLSRRPLIDADVFRAGIFRYLG